MLPFPSQCLTLSAASGEAAFFSGGGGDLWAFVHANVSAELTQLVRGYYESGARARLRLGYVNGTIEHAAHGPLDKRQYRQMRDWLAAAAFAPSLHTRTTNAGLPVAAAAMPEALGATLRGYWAARQEDAAAAAGGY